MKLQMATIKARIESFQDADALLEWATTFQFQEDPLILERLEFLRRQTGQSNYL